MARIPWEGRVPPLYWLSGKNINEFDEKDGLDKNKYLESPSADKDKDKDKDKDVYFVVDSDMPITDQIKVVEDRKTGELVLEQRVH